MTNNKITEYNQYGCYEIRMESIGGLGANLAGKMLAEAGVLRQGLNGTNFSSYGSEKQGTPIKTFVRFANPDTEILINSPVEEPHLVVVFHENLIKSLHVTQGLSKNGKIIVNTTKTPDEMRDFLRLPQGTIYCADALKIAIETKSRVNTVLLGVICKTVPFLDKNILEKTIEDTFIHKYPALVKGNLEAFNRGYNEVQSKTFAEGSNYKFVAFKRELPKWGFKTAPLGGVIPLAGNSVLKDLTASRQGFIPLFNREKCTDCGECDMTCPDYCFIWKKIIDKNNKENVALKGINYQYCKGCLKCVEICKPGALTKALEVEHNIDEITIKKIPNKAIK